MLKLKISKPGWLLLIIGTSVLLLSGLGMAYGAQEREQRLLNQELTVAQIRLKKFSPEGLASQQRELESQIAQLELGIADARTKLSQSIENIEVTDAMFAVAESSNVTMTEVSLSSPVNQEIEGVAFLALPLTLRVNGRVPDLITFISEINTNFKTSTINSADINISENSTEERASADIRLSIHSYEGD